MPKFSEVTMVEVAETLRVLNFTLVDEAPGRLEYEREVGSGLDQELLAQIIGPMESLGYQTQLIMIEHPDPGSMDGLSMDERIDETMLAIRFVRTAN